VEKVMTKQCSFMTDIPVASCSFWITKRQLGSR
jgi:hypothetical protein